MNVPSSSNCHPAHILLIDDNRIGLSARKAVLEELGYQITTVASAHDGLKRLAETEFALIITDYKMPRMNGIQFIERIRQQAPTPPVILLSGFADALGLDEKNTGADVVIQKSANEVAHMVRAVKKLLRKRAAKKPPGVQQTSQPRAQRSSG